MHRARLVLTALATAALAYGVYRHHRPPSPEPRPVWCHCPVCGLVAEVLRFDHEDPENVQVYARCVLNHRSWTPLDDVCCDES